MSSTLRCTAIACAALVATTGALSANAEQSGHAGFFRYTFDLELSQNDGLADPRGNAFASLPLGTTGTVSVDVAENVLITSTVPGATFVSYQILDASLDISGSAFQATPGVYPSANFFTGFNIENIDDRGLANRGDNLVTSLAIDAPGLIQPNIIIAQGRDSLADELFTSTDLPASIDLSRADPTNRVLDAFLFPTGSEKIKFTLTGVDIAFVPTPAAGTVWLLACASLARRRR